MRHVFFAVVLSLLSLSAAAAQDYKLGDLVIDQPWSRATPPGAKVGGGYMIIHNNGTMPDRLISATATVSDTVQLHEMGMTNGVMTMRALPDGVSIPASGKVEFKPGGYHVMFLNLKSPLKQGDRIKAHLTFEHAGGIDVEFEVGGIGQTTPTHTHDMPM